TVDVDTLASLLDHAEQRTQFFAVQLNAILKGAIRSIGVELELELPLSELIEFMCLRRRVGGVVLAMCCEATNASPVDVVQGGAKDTHSGSVKDVFEHPERVVLEVLMADRVVRVLLEHRRHVSNLKDPDPRV